MDVSVLGVLNLTESLDLVNNDLIAQTGGAWSNYSAEAQVQLPVVLTPMDGGPSGSICVD